MVDSIMVNRFLVTLEFTAGIQEIIHIREDSAVRQNEISLADSEKLGVLLTFNRPV
jgi:hypothetical protein